MRALFGICAIAVASVATLVTASASDPTVTYSRDIARLFQDNCQTCHRAGELAPPLFDSYASVYRDRRKILRAVETRKMPPWKPVPGFGDIVGSRRLSDADIAMLRAWVAADAPEGDARDLPAPRVFPSTWTHGQPDVVIEPSEAFEVPVGADDLYRCFVIPTRFSEDRYLAATEFLPGHREIVHHVLTYLDTRGHAELLDRAEPGPGYTCFGGAGFPPVGGIGGWAPGSPPSAMPDGVGMLLPAGATVVMQVHYHNRTGAAQMDRTRIGLHFARTRVDKRARSIPVLNRGFEIPAGAERHVVRATHTTQWDFHAIGVTPHMHLLGRSMKVTATTPDGTVHPLVFIDDWDFHWQGGYTFARPIRLPAGTRIDVEAVYDNSTKNKRNPNTPPRETRWGENTTDEMCIAFVRVTADAERLGHEPRYATKTP